MRHILFFVFMATTLSNCNKGDDSIDSNWLRNQSIEISGTNRTYHLYIPDNSVNAPVVFLLHGNRSNNDEIMGFTNQKAPYKVWETIAQQEGIILVVPNGTNGSSGHRGWNDCRNDSEGNPTSNDVQFIETLLESTLNTYQANSSKVFAVGTSNGGHMAMRLAKEIPNKLKAFAAIVASHPVNSQCTNSTAPISALFMNGTEDPINPFEGGQMKSNRGEVFSAQETIDYWVNRNQTTLSPTLINLSDTDTRDDSTVKKYVYSNGTNGTEVVLYEVIGGGHTEPSVQERYSNAFKLIVKEQNGDIEMANEVWDFFKNK